MPENSSRDNPALRHSVKPFSHDMVTGSGPRPPLYVSNFLHITSASVLARVLNPFMAIILLLSSACVGADIHRWHDREAAAHIDDLRLLNEQPRQIALKPNVSEVPGVENLSVYPDNNPEVILYSTARFGYCRQAREYFRSHDIEFTEYDVETSNKGKRDYKRMDARGVPVIFVGKKKLKGFSEATFEKAYRGR